VDNPIRLESRSRRAFDWRIRAGANAAFDAVRPRLLGPVVLKTDLIADLTYQLLGTVLIHGLAPPFDKRGFQVHDVVIVGPAQQPDCPS
jgi:hypothetical protein